MSRIRTIKPEFFTSEDIVSLTPLARLFYVSLWCEADREGRLNWKLRTLKMRYLPADDCDIELLANELEESGLIELYEVDGKMYCLIPGFKSHQVINNRESESIIPEPQNQSRVKDASPRVKAEGKEGRERKGKEGASQVTSKPDGVEDQVWKDYIATRKVKLTPTALQGIQREAEKAGVTLNQALKTCAERGWRGFKAEWVLVGGASSPTPAVTRGLSSKVLN